MGTASRKILETRKKEGRMEGEIQLITLYSMRRIKIRYSVV